MPKLADDSEAKLAAVLEISHELVTLEEQPLLNLILNRLAAVVNYSFAAITGVEAEKLTILAYRGPIPVEQVVGCSFSMAQPGTVHQSLEPSAPSYDPVAELIQAITSGGTGGMFDYRAAYLILPLIFRDQNIGFFCLGHNRPNPYDLEELELILALANYAALAIGHNRRQQQVRSQAIMEERSRLGQELHDNLAQILAVLKQKVIATNMALAAGQMDEAQANLRVLKQLISETYTDVREEIFNLRAGSTSSLSFLEMLHKYVLKYKKFYGLNIQVVAEDESLLEFPVDVGIQVIRVIQEALLNVRKHANVDQAHLSFSRTGEQILIRIEDEGEGFNPEQLQQLGKSGFGLDIMRERTESIGGTLEVESQPGQGSRIIMTLPTVEQPLNEPTSTPRNYQDYLLFQC